MQIEREKFLIDLELVQAGLSPREFIEQSSCFVFQDGWVMTFNDEVACRKKIGINLNGAVQAATLLAILRKMEDPELLVRENDKGELEFKGQKKGFGVTKDAEIFLPIDRVETPKNWVLLPKEFTPAVAMVQHCVSTDESRFLLTCIHITPNMVEACDNLQIMRVKVKTGIEEEVLVRGSSLKHIASLGMEKVAMTQSWIHFKNPAGLIFSCRRYTETYPDLKKVMAVDGSPVIIPKGLAAAAERAEVFATDKSGDPLISVSLSAGAIRIKGEGLSGWYKETRQITYDGPAISFVIAPELLKYLSETYEEAEIGADKLKVSLKDTWDYVTVLGVPAEEPAEGEVEKPAPKKKKATKDES